ncbi:hypothetical protein F9C07_7354 [Aspergillus flavus]|uniref:Uncharacterized protein n=1 Tax=Aspergillus flavus (strain ATCC 200026 / FGSC A1120 / IAM 13836 / NRRL 3357 / JCM 12722 / SRRC 167) TaxID=332952 RepID=A0A7U2MMQ1_ASPFN|nr:hypothetical protein F9C07_7354 [Aspergillus flavus]
MKLMATFRHSSGPSITPLKLSKQGGQYGDQEIPIVMHLSNPLCAANKLQYL